MNDARQPDLFGPLLQAYADTPAGELSNDQLYEQLSGALGVEPQFWDKRAPVGASGQMVSLPKRRARWMQQTMRQLGLLERTETRGVWRLTSRGREAVHTKPRDLTMAFPGHVCLGFSTKLGLALWAEARDVFTRLDEPVHLVLTSTPYPLQRARAYGNPPEHEFSDWICAQLEPAVKLLAPGGSIALNLGQDIFLPGVPERSLYIERAILDLHRRLGLSVMDRLIWNNPSKPPGPTRWACVGRQQLVHTWEPIIWFTNSPELCFADNRRVLRPHSERHAKLIERGGEQRRVSYGDGSHRIRPGSFSAQSQGSIPRNILTYSHTSREVAQLRRAAADLGLPPHGAMMPKALAKFLIEFLTEPDHLVADLFAGWMTTAIAAEETGRRWVASERVAEYVAGGSLRFADRPGFTPGFAIDPSQADGDDAADLPAPRG